MFTSTIYLFKSKIYLLQIKCRIRKKERNIIMIIWSMKLISHKNKGTSNLVLLPTFEKLMLVINHGLG